MNIKIVFPGHPMVKKNGAKTSMFFKDQKTGRLIQRKSPVHYYTTQYRDWAKIAIQTLAVFKSKHTDIPFPLTAKMNLRCLFYLGKDIKVDLSALYEGVQDCMAGNAGIEFKNVTANMYQIIEDDSARYIGSHDGSRVLLDYTNPRTEVYLTPFKMEIG